MATSAKLRLKKLEKKNKKRKAAKQGAMTRCLSENGDSNEENPDLAIFRAFSS
jgi:hypothetical protein